MVARRRGQLARGLAGRRALVVLGTGRNVVEVLVLDFQPTRNRAVDDGLQLRVDGIEVDGACEYDDVGIYHLLQNFRHVVFYGAFAAVRAAIVAGMAVTDLFIGNANFFHFVARFLRALCELVA